MHAALSACPRHLGGGKHARRTPAALRHRGQAERARSWRALGHGSRCARTAVRDEILQALHSGATQMLDGSIAPRRTQLVIDMYLADLPAMQECLATMRLGDLRKAQLVGVEEEAENLASGLASLCVAA